jgi:hypothetical protein
MRSQENFLFPEHRVNKNEHGKLRYHSLLADSSGFVCFWIGNGINLIFI